jgi:phosphoribosylglycinamide formyltransferase-1
MRLGILVSGRGSNLEAVLDAIAAGRLPSIEAALVIANRAGIRALEVAARRGVPWRVLTLDDFPDADADADADARDAAIGGALSDARCDLALLAPYFAAYAGRTINIHPSLLPRHGGAGMVGLAVHAAVLAAGEVETGVTIHDVTPALDAGPAILQRRVPVLSGDSAAVLAARVLEVEHLALVEVLSELSGSMTAGSPAPIRAQR